MPGRSIQSLVALHLLIVIWAVSWAESIVAAEPDPMRIGIIGLDTSHVIAFTQVLNAERPRQPFNDCRIVAAYPYGSREIHSSSSRIPEYTAQVQASGVEILDSIDELAASVDAVMLETNDGRLHLEQALPVLRAKKPLFIDKPVAASLADVIAIFEAAAHYGGPVFSASSLRYGKNTQAVRGGAIGEVLGCDTFGPCDLEPTHPDLFWYGVHGVESLYTVMKPGCERVRRVQTPSTELVVGEWSGGRIGTYRGMRVGARDYGGMAFGAKGNQTIGGKPGYEPLLLEIVKFFRTGVAPVSADETIEIFAFMTAAEESELQNGAAVSIASVLEVARAEAKTKQSW